MTTTPPPAEPCTLIATVGKTTYPCRDHAGGHHHFAADLPDPCAAPFCRLPGGHFGLHDIPSGRATYAYAVVAGRGAADPDPITIGLWQPPKPGRGAADGTP